MLRKKNIFCSLAALLFAVFNLSAQKTTFTNPVQAGDYPDPSVIRVGKDFYATATSSEWSPEYPILHSRDLVNWKIVGEVFPKRPEWSVGNYWAPEIWQENGVYYIFYTARKAGGNLCIAAASAQKPTGPYTDHGPLECQEVGSIDAFPIRDENGKLFIFWKEDGNSVGKATPIWAQELDLKTWKLIGEKKEIMRNDTATWEGTLIEGPFIMRRGEYFYMFYAANFCCGRGCNYATGVARSKTLLGNWEKYSENPILKGNENFNCPGHGSAVTLEDGRTFFMYHAYDPKDFQYVGRQALIDEINWTKDGWATINNGKGASKISPSPLGVAEKDEEYSFFDDFTSSKLTWGLQWQHNNVPNYKISNGFLELAPNSANSANPIGAIMAYQTTVGNYNATTQIETKSVAKGVVAGISAYGDNENALGFGWQDGKIIVWRREKSNHRILSTHNAPAGNQLYLRINGRDGMFFNFSVSTDGKTFQKIGFEQNGEFLPPWDRGIRIVMTVGGVEKASARFGFLRIEPTK